MKKSYNVLVKESWCKACGICVEVCPTKVFILPDGGKARPVEEDNCVGCMQCVNLCPELAIQVVDRKEDNGDE